MQYYAWIRLHHGVLPGGLERKDFVVQRTKFYVFPEIGQQPVTGELHYEMSRANEDAINRAPTTGWMENVGAINRAPTEVGHTEKEEVALDERG